MKKTALRKGFTLLELLMVVIVIAILAAIALPQYIKVTEKARAAEALQIVGAVRSSEMRYRAQSPGGIYTDILTELDMDLPVPTATPQWDYAQMVATVNAGPVGSVEVPRVNSAVAANNTTTVGIQFGTGTICGTFPPMAVGVCTQD